MKARLHTWLFLATAWKSPKQIRTGRCGGEKTQASLKTIGLKLTPHLFLAALDLAERRSGISEDRGHPEGWFTHRELTE